MSYTITHPRECAITDTLPPLDVKYGFRCVNMVYNLFSSSKSPRWTWSIKVQQDQHYYGNLLPVTISPNADFKYTQFSVHIQFCQLLNLDYVHIWNFCNLWTYVKTGDFHTERSTFTGNRTVWASFLTSKLTLWCVSLSHFF
jgi:hypothetical protein